MKLRRLFGILAVACMVVVLVTLDVGFREGTVVVHLRWFQLPLLAGPVAWVLVHNKRLMEKRLRAERREDGLCTACGYDVRASPERCPECGEVVNAPDAPESRVTR